MSVIVTNIQRFSLHDGPGIRTTVFLKGCNLRCPWCSNPENIDFKIQSYNLPFENGYYGKEFDMNSLENEILKDVNYFEGNGGVTFSGGEPLIHVKIIEPLLKRLKEKNINICVETSLVVPTQMIELALKYVDEFIIDIKILDEEKIHLINGDINLYKENLKKLYSKNRNIVFRIPLVPMYTVTEKNIDEIINLLKSYKPKSVEIFKLHKLARKKYESLNLKIQEFEEISNDEIEKIKTKIEQLDIKVKYCKI